MARVSELPTVAAESPGPKWPAPSGHFGAFAPGVGFQNRPPLPSHRDPMTSAPLVSFCVPTYNRCRYLASLLESLVVQLADFPFSFELVIADNGSTDATAETIAAYADRLPIRALRHATNIGGYGNWQFVLAQAAGRYVVYVADDDSILGDQVATAIAKMEADPELGVVYAPWLLFDLVAHQSQGQFFTVP